MTRLYGLDALKAFFSLCVVLVHLGYVYPSGFFNLASQAAVYLPTLSDIVNFYILLLAVPVFFLVANYLYCVNPRGDSFGYLFFYVARIAKLFVFWTFCLLAFRSEGWVGLFEHLPTSLVQMVSFIASGARTLYYYFFSLIILVTITFIIRKAGTPLIIAGFILFVTIVAALPLIAIQLDMHLLVVHWNPIQFFPYPFAAVLIYRAQQRFSNKQKLLTLVLLVLVSAIFSIADWSIYVEPGFRRANIFPVPAYSRPSLVFLSMAAVFLMLTISVGRNSVVEFMSKNSLALYCIHPFFIFPGGFGSQPVLIWSLVFTVGLSYASALILRVFLNKTMLA